MALPRRARAAGVGQHAFELGRQISSGHRDMLRGSDAEGDGNMDVALFAAGLLIGAVAVGLIMLRRAVRAEQETARARDEATRTRAELAAAERHGEEKLALVRDQLADQMKSISSGVLKEATEQLTSSAKQAREAERLDIKHSLAPIAEHLKKVEAEVTQLEKGRQLTQGTVSTLMKSMQDEVGRLRTETGTLVTALKRPQVRGAWGEMQLKNCVEAANMTAHVDFDTQRTVGTVEDGRRRPDMVVKQAGGRQIVVDAKVPLDAYLSSIEGTEEERAAHLDRHAQQLRTHLQGLASKNYHAQFESSPELVVCFVPMEALLVAALDRDPALFETWLARGIAIATPMTLVTLLRIAEYGWRQDRIEQSAREISKTGQELHKRIGTFLEPFVRAGKQLGSAVNAYNEAAGSLEARVLPQARRIAEHGAGSEKELPTVPRLDNSPRLVAAPELPGMPELPDRDAA